MSSACKNVGMTMTCSRCDVMILYDVKRINGGGRCVCGGGGMYFNEFGCRV